MLLGVMNLPHPPTKFTLYNGILLEPEECTNAINEALEEAVVQNGGSSVALDGSWQKRGFSLKNGIVSATSLDTGKVIDISNYVQVLYLYEKEQL